MKNAPTEEKKKEEKGLERLYSRKLIQVSTNIARRSSSVYRLLTRGEREEALEIRSAAEAARRPTDNKMITREYTGNYRNDNDEENDDNNGDSVDEGEGG